MARKANRDERQVALPGFAAPAPPVVEAPAIPPPKPRRKTEKRSSPPDAEALAVPADSEALPTDTDTSMGMASRDREAREGDMSVGALATRLSPAELDEFAEALTDAALGQLVLAAVRQMRRRLARAGGRSGKAQSSVLGRVAQKLAAELGGRHGDEDA